MRTGDDGEIRPVRGAALQEGPIRARTFAGAGRRLQKRDDAGRTAAGTWLAANIDALGTQSTIDIREKYL